MIYAGLVEAVIGRIERESHQFGVLLLFGGDTGLGGFRRKLAQRAVHAVLHVYRRHVRVGSLLEIAIRMLKELNMSIKEIEMYRKQPTPDNFLKIADTKEQELDLSLIHI